MFFIFFGSQLLLGFSPFGFAILVVSPSLGFFFKFSCFLSFIDLFFDHLKHNKAHRLVIVNQIKEIN